jgi:hypothetical protein
VSKMAILMSHMEGFGVPGSIPTVRNNPLDLRHGPNASHPPDDPDGIGYNQIQLWATTTATGVTVVGTAGNAWIEYY